MISLPRKAKQFLIALVKLCVVGGAFYFIYDQLANNDKLDWVRFEQMFKTNWNIAGISFILLFSVLNRYFEILKWQNLASTLRPMGIGEATKQVLGALTASIFTPNGIGEYGAKALFFDKIFARQVVFLNLICNGIQMVLTVVLGTLGLLYFNAIVEVITERTVLYILGLLAVLIGVSFFIRKFQIKGYSIERLVRKINSLPKKVHRKNLLLALLRYAVFSHQYYFLFIAFDVDLPYLTLISVITAIYFLASSLPTFQFLDFAVKGSVAVYFFGLLGINEWIVVFIATLMWFLNVVLPVVIGSYFVLKFKPQWK